MDEDVLKEGIVKWHNGKKIWSNDLDWVWLIELLILLHLFKKFQLLQNI